MGDREKASTVEGFSAASEDEDDVDVLEDELADDELDDLQEDRTDDGVIKVTSLRLVPAEYRDSFVVDGDGFRYDPRKDLRLAALEEKHAAELAALDAQLVDLQTDTSRLAERYRSEAIGSALRDALGAAGVRPALIASAASALTQALAINVVETKVGSEKHGTFSVEGVNGPLGVVPLAHAVRQWLAVEGMAFMPVPKPVPGKFATAIRELRMH